MVNLQNQKSNTAREGIREEFTHPTNFHNETNNPETNMLSCFDLQCVLELRKTDFTTCFTRNKFIFLIFKIHQKGKTLTSDFLHVM